MTRVLYLRQQAWKLLELSRTLSDAGLRRRLESLSRESELISLEMETLLTQEAVKRRERAA